ncbi:MAG: hypothetical protein H0S79_13255 [Anaerolineaceae bacterium]|nr:hypothetical protein [Anaerolineaceae bacterium]
MMTEYYPHRRTGILLHGALVLWLLATGGYFFLRANQDASGLDFLLHMMIALVLFAPLLLIGYRLYALMNAVYILRRDGLLIRWGLRREDIPLNDIEWIRPATELGFHLPMPWLRWPGAILGVRRTPELGQVEFLAADVPNMLLVATSQKVFAISPEDVNGFMSQFQHMNELGSLTPIPAQSVYPRLLIGRVWDDRLSRLLILGGFGVGLILLVTVSVAAPGLGTIAWTTTGSTAPAERLLLLSVLDGLIWLFNLILGMFLYRRGEDQIIAAYLLWGSSALTGLLLLIGSLLLIF